MIRSSKRSLLAAGLCAAMLTACGGGGGQSGIVPSSSVPQPNPVTNSPSGSGSFQYGQAMLSQMAYLGPATVGNLSTTVAVRMRNAQGLIQYAAQANDPRSGLYRQWLTPQEIGDKFGASTSDYQAAASYFRGYGLKVGMWPQREALSISGSIGQFQRAFGTKFGVYRFRGKQVIAPAAAPHFASSIPVTGSSPMMTAAIARSYLIHGNNAKFLGYSPQQVATGFDYSGAYATGFTGKGINVGIIGTGPILNGSGGDDDTTAYKSYWRSPMASITQIAASPQPATMANGGTGTGSVDANPAGLAVPPPVTAPCAQPAFPTAPNLNTCNPEDGEAQLDTESIASLAPASNVLFYLAYNPGECVNPTTGAIDVPTGGVCPSGDETYPLEGLQIVDDEYQQAIADNKADILSMSFGEPENVAAAFNYISSDPNNPGIGQVEFASMAAEGTALFVSSGDDGAWECFDPSTGSPLGIACPSYPATDPNVVAVGGVNIPLDENGNLVGEIAAWADNTTKGGNGSFSNNVGSGGGVSTVFSAPSWQKSTLGVTMREEPDMSLDADPLTGQSLLMNAASALSVGASGGTSMAAPEAAAQWALVLQACAASSSCKKLGTNGYRLGNPNAFFYAIYSNSTYAKSAYTWPNWKPGLDYAHVFDDVLYGANQAAPAPGSPSSPSGYNSGPGYDEVTGLGAPFTGHLIQAITGTNVR